MREYQSVINTLTPVLRDGRSLDHSWDQEMTPLGRQIAYGVLRDYFRLSAIVDSLVQKPVQEKHLDVSILLLAGLYSVDAIKRPAYASVNDVVETAMMIGKPWAKGLINGVLRNYLRQRDAVLAALDESARRNHPAWMINAICDAWPDRADTIFEANNQKAPMTLRVNVRRNTRQEYQARLQAAGIGSHIGDLSPVAVYLDEPVDTDDLPGFAEGCASVQDEASQMAAILLDPQPRDRILDACAAPGGKTCHLLELAPDGHVVAIDNDARRMRQVEQNLSRLGFDCERVIHDFRTWQSPTQFERILLDAPCSATGIIRRHPDIKLLRRETDVAKLAETQTELLQRAWQLLTPGGVLVYSTCSILPAENEGVISRFLHDVLDADALPPAWGYSTGIGSQLFPHPSSHDGFFYARLVKRTS